MLKITKIVSILVFGGLLFSSCSTPDDCSVPVEEEFKVEVTIDRLESEFLQIESVENLNFFAESNPIIAEFFLRSAEYPNNEIFFSELLSKLKNPYMDSLRFEVEKQYPDLSWLEDDLSSAFSRMKSYYPELKVPKVKTIATGFDHDLYVSDSLIVIGLDYYMGADSKYRPQGMYNYILKRYEKKYIVPSIMLLYGISNNFNLHNERDVTVLSDMISYGKAFYFAKKMIPCTPDSTIIWYSDKEFEGINQNQDIVWAHFVEEELLFQTSHLVKRKYIDERPKTYEIGPECPARVATWLGWEIVKKYADDHPEASLNEIMGMSDAKQLFDAAKYRPR